MTDGKKLAKKALTFAEAAALAVSDILIRLDVSKEGLASDEVNRRLEEYGPNELKLNAAGPIQILLRQLKSAMVYLLAFAAALSFILGEILDGATILGILLLNAGIGFFQEYRSEQALKKLEGHLSPRARVRRNGETVVIERRRLVPGDLIMLEPGDIAPADSRLIVSQNLTVDESVLTGESVNVQKTAEPMTGRADQPYQARNCVFMMTRIVSGFGEAIVTATGAATVTGSLAKLTEETVHVSAFQKNMEALSRFLLKAVGLILAATFAANILLKGDSQIVPQLLFAVALAVSVIPEALPAVTAITLSKGALALAKRHVIVKRLSAIEDLGHIQVLCTDKTGTLTESIMSVAEIACADAADCHLYALAASAEEEFADLNHPKTFGAALMARADEASRARFREADRRWFAAFDPERRRTTAVIAGQDGRDIIVAMGAPEEILGRCSRVRNGGTVPSEFSAEHRGEAERRISEAGRKGWRVLAIATRGIEAKSSYGDADETEMTYRGYVAFSDPLKATAHKAVQDARRLNVAVKILTGDSPEVAGAVGREVGIISRDTSVITGADLDAMSDVEFHDAVSAHSVFARVTPEQKYRVIEALQHDFQVGFLGEGINDAPALKLANVSLVVQSASDVAREAADIILLRKDLHVIIDGIREGRAIFTNVIKYVKYTLIGNVGNFLAVAGVSLTVEYLPMLPVQILLTNMLTDLPLMTVADDSVDEQDLRWPKAFSIRELAFAALFLGFVSTAFDFIYFAFFRMAPPATVQTGWFMFSIMTEMALIYSIRTAGPFWKAAKPSRWLVKLSIVAILLGAVAATSAFGHDAFRFTALTSTQWYTISALVVAYFAVTEAVKLFYAKSFNNQHAHS